MKRPSTVSRETWACMTKKERHYADGAASRRIVSVVRAEMVKMPAWSGKTFNDPRDAVKGAPEHLVKRLK